MVEVPTTVPATAKTPEIDVEKAQSVIFQPNLGPQTDFLASSEQEVLYGGSAGGGKGVPPETKVLTPFGWKAIGDLKVGSRICGSDGTTQTILNYYRRGVQPRYKLTFSDGTETICDEDHLWLAHVSRGSRKISGVPTSGADGARKWTTKEIFSHYQTNSQRLGIPLISQPAQFTVAGTLIGKDQFVKVSPYPYTLGVLLGDGNWTQGVSTFFSVDQEIVDSVEAECGITLKKSSCKDRDGAAYKIPAEFSKPFIEPLGLWGTYSNTKFIPKIYLFSSVETRKALLQGLMDTDGWSEEDGDCYYTSVSKQLIEDVTHLARSLGYYVSTRTKVPTYTHNGEKLFGQLAYTIRIKGNNTQELFRLRRKVARTEGKTYQSISNWINNIQKIDDGETVCITVSNPNSLFVIENFIVTHNSFAMVADPVRNFNNPRFRGLLLRRTTEELRELLAVSKELYPKAIPGIKFLEREKTWIAPSGASLWMSYLDADDDVSRYQGLAFAWVGFDELTQWRTPFAWNFMRSRLRVSSNSGLKTYMRATTNPGNSGHQWVKKMFIDPAPPNTPFWATDIETGETLSWPKGHSRAGEPLLKRRFIPASMFDNPYLAADGMYEANLLSLPEHQRRQLLHGDWDINEGAAFPEFNRHIHVVEPFDIPSSWPKFRAADYGYGSNTGVLWFTVSPAEQLIIYRELYVSKVTAWDLADLILEAESGEKIRYGVLDSSLWHNRGDRGPSLAEQMISKGCRWRPSDRSRGSRVAGKNEIHRRLQVDEFTGQPKMVIFDTCKSLISQLPSIPLDKHNPEDVDTKAEDHLYDALRYGIMSRPRSSIWDYNPMTSGERFKMADSTFGY